jgi:hypothetical protein
MVGISAPGVAGNNGLELCERIAGAEKANFAKSPGRGAEIAAVSHTSRQEAAAAGFASPGPAFW